VAITITDTALLRLLQLSSASLPVGGYAFSQGLEYAIEQQWVCDQEAVGEWLHIVMHESVAKVDMPLLQRLTAAVEQEDQYAFNYWNHYVIACRETTELALTETAMGEALARLLRQLKVPLLPLSVENNIGRQYSFIAAFASASVHWKITPSAIAVGYLWSWLENQIAAATKLVPLGQSAAQQLLITLTNDLTPVIHHASAIEDDAIGSSLPGMSMASSWHETQYSRLFRS